MPKNDKTGLQQLTPIKTVPFIGGCNTVLETQQIPMGMYSMVQNMRDTHPGKQKRKGQRKQHSSADGTTTAMTMYQFNKTRIPEKHFFAQKSDSDVLKATTDPPGITTGAFGSEVYSGSASPVPASWSTIRDALIFSNGVDQHQIYYGTLSYVEAVVVYLGSGAPPSIPALGKDYTDEATDGTAAVVVLDNFGAYGVTLVTNGTFPSGIGNWTDNSTGDGSFAFDTDHAELDANTGTAEMGQTITLINGANYELTFTVSENCTGLAVTGGTAAYGGTQHFTQTYTSTGAKTIDFTAAGTSLYLEFKSETNEVVSLDDIVLASYECAFICSPVAATGMKYTVSAANGTTSVASLYYRKSDNTWTELTNGTHGWVDGTITSSKTLATTGTMAWTTQPTDEIPMFMFGRVGYWYQLRVDTMLDSEVELTAVQFTNAWQSIENLWDGVRVPVIEMQFFDDSDTVYKTFGATSIEIDSATSSDKFHFACSDLACAIYVDVGSKPNTTASTTVNAVYYWDGKAYTSVGTVSDGTNGLANSGWITFARKTAYETQFNEQEHYAYWYYFTVDKTLNDDVIIALYTQPYFSIDKLGKGYCNTVWKGRAVYGTNRDQYIYLSALGRPQVLNGDDFGILEPGDGRSNLPVAMEPFNNELMVWQEEKGKEGGCLTLFEGYSPLTWGRLIISTKIGTLNAKTVVIVDGVYTSTKTDEVVGKIAYFVSHYGFYMTDGRFVTGISDDIQNYFDPLEPECIRRGYEDQMWAGHDTAKNSIRLGLVSGISVETGTATSTSGSKLVVTTGAFTTRKTVSGHAISHTIAVGDTVYNTTDDTTALITAVDSATALSLDTDIMVSGEGYEIYSSTCNLFPVLDLVTKTWGFDLFEQSISCFTEVEAGSGDVNIIQLVGGVKDGFIYQSNYGNNDVSTKIKAFVDIELNAEGKEMVLRELILTAKTGTALTITPTVDGTQGTAITESSLLRVRNKYSLNSQGTDIKLRVENNTTGESVHLFSFGLNVYSDEAR